MLIADAAISILGTGGARALTHRAVDQVAGLPQGATSNLFRSRAALLGAANQRLAQRTLEQVQAATVSLAEVENLHPPGAAEVLAAIVVAWATVESELSCARLELYLEAHRTPELAVDLDRARESFRELAAQVLMRAESDVAYAVPTIALLEGLLVNQLLHPATRLGREELVSNIRDWLGATAFKS